jgi:manganese transport protein
MAALRRIRQLGPGFLVAAAFIGPGTVTTASVAGARFGHDLLWAVGFSILATIILQEMAARLGLVTRAGLGEALRTTFRHPAARVGAIGLVVGAIAFGNAAYQAGNLTGAAIGLEALTGLSLRTWAPLVGLAAFGLLISGAYRWIERVLIALVAVMSIVFVTTMVMGRPDFSGLARGLLVPRMPDGSLLTVLALIGTTVVPYNLFLHASAATEKWGGRMPTGDALRAARTDAALSISLGGLVTIAIVMTAAAVFARGTTLESAAAMAAQLEPLLGPAAHAFFAAGLLAAGLTSAITAPLAAAYATTGALGWPTDLTSGRFRAVWVVILAAGVIPATLGARPVAAIVLAQALNGLLLPVVAVFLLVAMNRTDRLGRYANGRGANVLGALVVLIAAALGAVQLLKVAGVA